MDERRTNEISNGVAAFRTELRLCSWNIHVGLERHALVRSVEENRHFAGLDMLFLQEASADGHRSDTEVIAEVLGAGYRGYQRTVDRIWNRLRGLGVIWNPAVVRIISIDTLALPHLTHPNVHRMHRYVLAGLRTRRRLALAVTAEIGTHSIRAYNIHLSPIGFAYQMEQFRTILRDNEKRPPADLVLLLGDFNSLRIDRRKWLAWFKELQQHGYVNISEDVDWTFRTFRSRRFPMRQKLDNVLIKTGWLVEHFAHSEDVRGSDHLPLFARLAWPANHAGSISC